MRSARKEDAPAARAARDFAPGFRTPAEETAHIKNYKAATAPVRKAGVETDLGERPPPREVITDAATKNFETGSAGRRRRSRLRPG